MENPNHQIPNTMGEWSVPQKMENQNHQNLNTMGEWSVLQKIMNQNHQNPNTMGEWSDKAMERKLHLERVKRAVENNYNFTENVKRNMTIYTVFYSITFILGVVFVYVNAHFSIELTVPRIVRNSIAGTGTFASLVTSMKTISETLSSARTKEITISEIDLNIANLATEYGPDVKNLKVLKELIQSRNNKLEKLTFRRSLWAFFCSIILIVVIILDFNFNDLVTSFILDGILCFVGFFGNPDQHLEPHSWFKRKRNALLDVMLFICLYLLGLVSPDSGTEKPSEQKYLLEDIKYKQYVISRVTFQQRNRKGHVINGESEKEKVEQILHGLGNEIV
ncbi:13918_t:CDS:2 [Funneliformis mosseae]|uniref:13918_t:CDS:1 n=1 Tax=Funneliformis mosseae TaxID=27381 RepID=A0A9N9HJQ1_FUNMO|nr:13918_t:CDS:2 [Funneliformis mosseae]